MTKYISLFIIILYSGMVVAQKGKTPALGNHCGSPKWRNEFIPHAFTAGINGTATQKGLTANIDKNSGNILNHMKVGVMGAYRITYRDLVMVGIEGWHNTLEASGKNDQQSVNVSMNQTMIELIGGVNVHPRLALLGGSRYNRLGGSIKSTETGGAEATESKQWVDPFIGARLNFPMGKKFSGYLRGDLGGFNVGSNSTWQVLPVLEFKPNYYTSILMGYRYMSITYQKGNGSNMSFYDVNIQGIDLGVSLRF